MISHAPDQKSKTPAAFFQLAGVWIFTTLFHFQVAQSANCADLIATDTIMLIATTLSRPTRATARSAISGNLATTCKRRLDIRSTSGNDHYTLRIRIDRSIWHRSSERPLNSFYREINPFYVVPVYVVSNRHPAICPRMISPISLVVTCEGWVFKSGVP
jgi:hypothetical protein